MDLVLFFQNISTSFLSVVFSVFESLSGFEFLLFLFAFLFLVVNKEVGYKYFLSTSFSFAVGSLFLKNIIQRPRPYNENQSIITEKDAYSFSCPSTSTTNAGISGYSILNSTNNLSKTKKLPAVILIVVYLIMVSISKIYFAKNYLLDVIFGILLGIVVSYFIFKFVKVSLKSKRIFGAIIGAFCLFLLCFFINDFINNSFDNLVIFEFCGVALSLIIGTLIEERFIKYSIKNNLILILLKSLIILIVFLGCHFLNMFLPGLLIIVFAKYFLMGIVSSVVLPIIFKSLQKYCYVFSNKVENKKVKESFITLSEKGSLNACKKLSSYIKNGDIIVMEGEMGAGKSFIVRGILNNFGVNKRITSPTFTLFNDYKVSNGHFYHFDLYRLDDEEETINIGFDEILDDDKSVKFIEWADKAQKYLPKKYKKITVVKLGKWSRNIIFEDYTN